MKRIFFLFSFLLFFIFLVGTLALPFVYAEEAPKYNFGSAQGAKLFSLKPGQEIEEKLYFYNVYGNRPTHVKLTLVEKPDWDITIEPGLETKDYEVSGIVQTVEENLVVYPSEAQESPGVKEEGKEWISSKVGYINADYVTLKIKIPSDEAIGKTFNIKINAVAFWLGQGGNIALQQERNFEYTITTTTEYYEKPYEAGKEAKVETESIGKKLISLISEPSQMKPLTMIAVGMTLIMLVIFVVLVILTRGKKKKR